MTSDSENVIDIYRRHAGAWTRRRERKLRERVWIDRFLAHLPEAPSVLDIGCGSGEPIDSYLLENGCTVTGVDVSPELIRTASERIRIVVTIPYGSPVLAI